MKLSEELNQIHMSGDAGLMLEGFSERAKSLEDALHFSRMALMDIIEDDENDIELYYIKQAMTAVEIIDKAMQ